MGNGKNWGDRPWTVDFAAIHAALPSTLDIAVVGGGFTGLAAAAWLKKLTPEKHVALFEAETFGAGSSGYTGGLALSETAAGDLPGLGDVLAGYQRILGDLQIEGDLSLPGVYELGRSKALENSPIHWQDSGDLQVVKQVAGGTIHPGKVLSGLARAAERAGVLLFERAGVEQLGFADKLELHSAAGRVRVEKVLLATNAFALEMTGLQGRAQAAFTTAVMTETLTEEVIAQIGLRERKPFYTVDMPYLWGRLLGNAVIFGSGLVFQKDWRGLHTLDIDGGEAREVFARLEGRICRLHPALHQVNFTHRWGGPICIAEEWKPVFEKHPKSNDVIVLGAYSGHGVAQSVFLGTWAAEALLEKRELPDWK